MVNTFLSIYLALIRLKSGSEGCSVVIQVNTLSFFYYALVQSSTEFIHSCSLNLFIPGKPCIMIAILLKYINVPGVLS